LRNFLKICPFSFDSLNLLTFYFLIYSHSIIAYFTHFQGFFPNFQRLFRVFLFFVFCLSNHNMVDSFDEDDVFEFGESEVYEPEQSDYRFSPLNTIHVDGVPDESLNSILMTVCLKETVSNKAICDKFGMDFDTAETLLEAFEQAGYVGERYSHYIRKVYVTLADYAGLCR